MQRFCDSSSTAPSNPKATESGDLVSAEIDALATRAPIAPAARRPSASVTGMTDRARRPRGAAKGNPVVYGHVIPEAKDVLATMAAALNISQAQAIEAVLMTAPLDADGVPSFVDRSIFHREELSIPAA